jgi:hypothetical protein
MNPQESCKASAEGPIAWLASTDRGSPCELLGSFSSAAEHFPILGHETSINTSFLSLGIFGDRMVYAVVLCSLGVPDQD